MCLPDVLQLTFFCSFSYATISPLARTAYDQPLSYVNRDNGCMASLCLKSSYTGTVEQQQFTRTIIPGRQIKVRRAQWVADLLNHRMGNRLRRTR